MAQWHSVDLTSFDVSPATRSAQNVSETVAKKAVSLARDVTYVTIGFGLLAYQRAQVRRRELERSLRN